MTSGACPPEVSLGRLLLQFIPSSPFQEATGGVYSEGISSFQGWLQGARGEAVGPEGRVLSGRGSLI